MAIVVISALALSAGAVPAVLVTTTGRTTEGSLSGIAPVIRLLRPDEATVIGLAMPYDIHQAEIRQITIDFPRLVIETDDGVLIGPFSAFTGIDELLSLDRTGQLSLSVPLASVRAIALNGHPLHTVPRAWLGDTFLTMPPAVVGTTLAEEVCDDCAISLPAPPSASADEVIWNGAVPIIPPDDTSREVPWWVGLLGVAVLVVLFMVLVPNTAE